MTRQEKGRWGVGEKGRRGGAYIVTNGQFYTDSVMLSLVDEAGKVGPGRFRSAKPTSGQP